MVTLPEGYEYRDQVPGWFNSDSPDLLVAGLFAKHFQAVLDSQAEKRRKIRAEDYVPHENSATTCTRGLWL